MFIIWNYLDSVFKVEKLKLFGTFYLSVPNPPKKSLLFLINSNLHHEVLDKYIVSS